MRTKMLVSAVILCIALLAAPGIDLNDYPVTTDRGTLTDREYSVFLDILDAVETGRERVPCSGEINHHKILTHLGMYYGTTEGISRLYVWTADEIILRLDRFRTLREHKIAMDARVDEALVNLWEGTDRFKLRQISRYIANHLTYVDGAVMCGDYAMLFYKLASRLGIQTYICYGYAGGKYHAWNMVELDERYFYDVTWYDSLRTGCFLHASGWGRAYAINNLWEKSK